MVGIQEIIIKISQATCSHAAVTSPSIRITMKLLQVLCLPAMHGNIIKFQPESDNDIKGKSLMFDPASQELEFRLSS